MLKYGLRHFAAMLAVSVSLPALAQPASPDLTRAQVRDEMVRYEAAGFNPARPNPRTWVDDAQAASKKVALAESGPTAAQVANHAAPVSCDQ